ncbi:MAG TPA: metal-dependent hydrolase [Acidimicrobiia bacterium]|nr:metal-dependent hydrolase [Acidimicrobiia bacterium]
MLFWHVGGAIFLFRWVFRDPKVDLRLLALGAVLPDVIDGLLGLVIGDPTTQRLGHSLVFPSLAAVVLLLLTRRGRRRRMFMTVVVAWLFHLLLDGVWLREDVFLWPFFGWNLGQPAAGTIWQRAAEPWRWVKEAFGLAYLWLLLRSRGS